jgi:hypothetical protein
MGSLASRAATKAKGKVAKAVERMATRIRTSLLLIKMRITRTGDPDLVDAMIIVAGAERQLTGEATKSYAQSYFSRVSNHPTLSWVVILGTWPPFHLDAQKFV